VINHYTNAWYWLFGRSKEFWAEAPPIAPVLIRIAEWRMVMCMKIFRLLCITVRTCRRVQRNVVGVVGVHIGVDARRRSSWFKGWVCGLRRRGVLSSITQTKEKRMKTQTWESRTGLDPSYNKIVVPGSDVRGTLSFVVRFGSEG